MESNGIDSMEPPSHDSVIWIEKKFVRDDYYVCSSPDSVVSVGCENVWVRPNKFLTWDRDRVSLQFELLANWGTGGSKLTFTSAA